MQIDGYSCETVLNWILERNYGCSESCWNDHVQIIPLQLVGGRLGDRITKYSLGKHSVMDERRQIKFTTDRKYVGRYRYRQVLT